MPSYAARARACRRVQRAGPACLPRGAQRAGPACLPRGAAAPLSGLLEQARLEARLELLPVEVLADEDQPVYPRLIAPRLKHLRKRRMAGRDLGRGGVGTARGGGGGGGGGGGAPRQ